ncbi:MAG: polysaccharide deacetylase family protein [Treponema sp.]|jgi:hypothetical protein|nr:polysaccharide deacetylase family protein [Treponema sp.]
MRYSPNRRFAVLSLTLTLGLAACASRPASPVSAPPAPPRPVEIPRPIERLAALVKNNDPALEKYFTQDEDAVITVKADWNGFQVTYDLQNARPYPGGSPGVHADGSSWELDFCIQETGGQERLEDSLRWTIAPGDSGILLSLDDDYLSQWERHFDLFDRYGAKITFFIIGEYSPFCTEALNRGHDIGYHTLNHLNLPKVSPETFQEETLSAVKGYREAGVPLRSFAYPFGFSEPWMREALAGTFAVQRGFGVRYHIYNRAAIKAGYIASISIDNIIYKTDEEFEAAVTMMLRAAKFIGGDSIVPLTTHTIAEDADWGIGPRRLEYLFQTVRELNMRFYLYRDF